MHGNTNAVASNTPNIARNRHYLQAVAGMDKFPGPHSGAVGKSPAFAGYPISPLHVKRRSSSNSSAGVGIAEEKLDAKGGGMMNDSDARYLPQLRRSEGRSDVQHTLGC